MVKKWQKIGKNRNWTPCRGIRLTLQLCRSVAKAQAPVHIATGHNMSIIPAGDKKRSLLIKVYTNINRQISEVDKSRSQNFL